MPAHRKPGPAAAKAARLREPGRGARTSNTRRLAAAGAHARETQPSASPESDASKALRVSTYNIHKGVLRDFTGLRRVARIHELRTRLHELDSDLIFLQEVQGQHQRYARRFAQWPAESQELFLSKSPTAQQAFQTAYGRNASYLHGHHGNALLSRFPIVGLENRDVSDHALEKRGVLHCTIDVGGRRIHCFVVHFGLFASSRERQLDALLEWIGSEVPGDDPLIIAGDFNDWRNTLSQRLCEHAGVVEVFDAAHPRIEPVPRAAYFVHDRLADVGRPAPAPISRLPRMVRTARTYPALVPWFRMDRIYQRGFHVSGARVLRGLEWARLSDHSPLVADLELIESSS